MSVVSVVCCQVEVSVSSWSLVRKSPTKCGVSVWLWSWILYNEEVLALWGLLSHGKKKALEVSMSDASFRCFHLKGPGFITVKIMMDLGWTQWWWDRFLPSSLALPCRYHSRKCSMLIRSLTHFMQHKMSSRLHCKESQSGRNLSKVGESERILTYPIVDHCC